MSALNQGEPDRNATTASANVATVVGVDLAKSVFQLAVANGAWQVVESHRRSRTQFERWFRDRQVASGGTRHLGRIFKRGGRCWRMLLTHGARSVPRAATVATIAGKTVDPLRHWTLAVRSRSNHNKAICALANKLARICYAALRDAEPYGTARLQKKVARTAFALPA